MRVLRGAVRNRRQRGTADVPHGARALHPAAWMYTDDLMHRASAIPIQDPVLSEIVRRLVDGCQPERIYLFGSRARGHAGANSDYDIMVIVPKSDEPAYRRAQRAHSLLWDLGAAADILVWTRETFDSRVHLRASLPATITREGQLLYAA
jgi:predicted nucleotidyltransferase